MDRECVAVTKEEEVIGHADDVLIEVVGNDYPLAGLTLVDQVLHPLHINRGYIRERLVEDAEFRLRHQDKIHLGYPRLAAGQRPERGTLVIMELILESDQPVVINAIERERLAQGHLPGNEQVLGEILDPSADVRVICRGLLAEPDEHVLGLYTAHHALEKA